MKDYEQLKTRWLKLFPESDEVFLDIEAYYSEPHRSYHNFTHIESCLNYFDEIQELLKDPLSIELAIWFHDIIYQPTASDNEHKSAELAAQILAQLGLDQQKIKKVEELILLTIHPSLAKTKDEEFLLDIDLSILGAGAKEYQVYEKAIRQEYHHVPERLFCLGRGQLLQRLLEQERLFHSEYFYEKFETQARVNLAEAIKNLH